MPRRFAALSSLAAAFILSIIGIFLVYSSTSRVFGFGLALRQVTWVAAGMLGAIAVSYLSRRRLYKSSFWLYAGGMFLLVMTFFIGVTVRGERSWLEFGLFRMQPAEIMKLFSIMLLATVGKNYARDKLTRLATIVLSAVVLILPALVILVKGDAGTALIYFLFFIGWLFILDFQREGLFFVVAVGGGTLGLLGRVAFPGVFVWPGELFLTAVNFWSVFFWGGCGLLLVYTGVIYWFNKKVPVLSYLVIFLVCLVAAGGLYNHLRHHQRQRLEAFVDPAASPLESGYHVTQARIAVGSGGLFGQGYLQGTQSQLGFIPELWTDFIYTVAIEELGLATGFFILLLYGLLIYGTMSTAVLAEAWWDFYACAGVALLWILHTVINLGFSLELIPVIGLPLPYLSYGGSFMVTNWLALGLVVSLSDRIRGPDILHSRVNFL